MQKTREEQIELFMRHVGYWSWIHVLYTYDDSHLLIADEWFIDQIRNARPAALQCRTCRPTDFEAAITPDIKKILVLCQQGELGLVKALKKAHPDLIVTSGTYGYACIGKDRYPRLKDFGPVQKKVNLKPTIILTTPYADGEFIAKVMENNGMPVTCEYLARPFSTWLEMHKGFQINRFYNFVAQYYAKKNQLSWLVQTDVLQSLFDNTPYSLQRFIRDLKRLDANVILVSRSGAWVQSVTAQIMHRTTERSVWTKSPNKKILSVRKDGDIFGCLDWGNEIRSGDMCLAEVERNIPDCLKLNLEDFVDNQADQIKKIAAHVGFDLADSIETLDYASGYETAPNVEPLAVRFQREFIDRLGLHVQLKF